MAQPTSQQLAYCVGQLTRFIPSPQPPKVKVQASKFGLKVGQLLGTPAGEVFKVVETDSRGLTLETPDGKVCRIERKEDISSYGKVKAIRKPRGKAKKVLSKG